MSAPESVSVSRLALLGLLFFCICMGLGYPSLNRVDWRTAPGLTDVSMYAGMVAGQPPSDALDHMRFRVLVPSLARPIYRAAKGHVGTWNPVMFGLLIVDSLFVAGTAALLLAVVIRVTGSYPVALGSALLYLLNFAVPNLRLAGFIDAGEGFFLMALAWCLLKERYWILPVLGVLGAMAKESFVPFLVVFTATWWICSSAAQARWRSAAWMVAAWVCALTSMAAVQWYVTGAYRSPVEFGLRLRGDNPVLRHLVHSFADRNLWYIFIWLLPLSLFRIGRFPTAWRMATAAACAAAFAMDAYYGASAGTIGRALFSVAGPLLSASVAMLLFERAGATPTEQPNAPEGAVKDWG